MFGLFKRTTPTAHLMQLPETGDDWAWFAKLKFHGEAVWVEVSAVWIGSGLLAEKENRISGVKCWVFYPAKGEPYKKPFVTDVRI